VVLQPLLDIKGIRARQDTIQELIENSSLRQDLRQLLRQIYDLEVDWSRWVWQCQCARFSSFADSLLRLPELARLVEAARSPFASATSLLNSWDTNYAPICGFASIHRGGLTVPVLIP